MTIPAEAREGTGGSAARAPESLSLFQMVDYLESGTPFQIVDHPESGTPLVDADFFFFPARGVLGRNCRTPSVGSN